MKKIDNLWGIIAFVVSMVVIACQQEPIIENQEENEIAGVTITVGAGIDPEPPAAKSEMALENGKRVLKFTSGDRLYVFGRINTGSTPKFVAVAGYLDMDGAPFNDGKKATFTGTLNAYNTSGVQIDYSLGSDPLSLCRDITPEAVLIHKDVNTNAINITVGKRALNQNKILDYSYMEADDVETLMTTCLPVHGIYNGTSFPLSCTHPILNCTLSGLSASTEYVIEVQKSDAYNNKYIEKTHSFTTNGSGTGTSLFVCNNSGNGSWLITILDSTQSSTIGTIDLGQKNLGAKIYNLSRHWNGGAFE